MMQRAGSRIEEAKRRSERVLLRMPIEVSGTDREERPFTERTHTLVINRNGARIALKASVRTDMRVNITNLQNTLTCPFRVVGPTGRSLGEGPEWGVECLEAGINFWGIYFPKKIAAAPEPEVIDALLECSTCSFRELAQLSMEQYQSASAQQSLQRDCRRCGATTSWKFGATDAGPREVVPRQADGAGKARSAASGEEKRRAKRLTVKLPVRVRLEDGREEVARTENLSATGVCFAASLVINPQDRVLVTVGYHKGGKQEEIPANMVWRRELEGTGRYLYGMRLDHPRGE